MYNTDMKRLYILAGAKGSGKSTIAAAILPAENISYINADDIAKELCPSDLGSVKIKAGKIFFDRTEECFKKQQSFVIESTLSGLGHIKTIKKAQSLGYSVVIAYVFVDSPQVCINRIKARVKNGGHHVPDADVIRRYARSRHNFINAYSKITDYWTLYYNGGGEILLVAAQTKGYEVNVFSNELYLNFRGNNA